MENLQSLSIESFSYNWLVDKKQPPMDVPNPRNDVCNNNEANHHLDKNFNFDIPLCNECPVSLVHADDIFSDGYMMPTTFVSHSRTQPSISAPATPFCSFTPSSYHARSQTKFLQRWKKSSSKMFNKCSEFLKPICKGLVVPRKSNRVDDLGRKVWEVENWRTSMQTPARSSVAYSVQSSPSVKNYYDVDSDSIKEAILHCKRSFSYS